MPKHWRWANSARPSPDLATNSIHAVKNGTHPTKVHSANKPSVAHTLRSACGISAAEDSRKEKTLARSRTRNPLRACAVCVCVCINFCFFSGGLNVTRQRKRQLRKQK